MTFVEVEPPHRIVALGRGGKFNRIKTTTIWTLNRSPGGGTDVDYMIETEPVLPTDRFVEALQRPARLVQAQGPQVALAAAIDPRGERGSRRARDGGGRLDSAPMRRLLVLALLAVVAAGCGAEDGVRTTAETEGLYLDINDLKYQVQMSRYMNPADVEDREYFVGLPETTPPAAADETWFGVWVRVENTSDEETFPSANVWEIHDTQENIYRPLPIDAEDNPFVYEPVDVPPKTVIPLSSTAAGQGPIQGQLLLFKIKTDSLQNRPLELRFSNGGDSQEGTYDLDV